MVCEAAVHHRSALTSEHWAQRPHVNGSVVGPRDGGQVDNRPQRRRVTWCVGVISLVQRGSVRHRCQNTRKAETCDVLLPPLEMPSHVPANRRNSRPRQGQWLLCPRAFLGYGWQAAEVSVLKVIEEKGGNVQQLHRRCQRIHGTRGVRSAAAQGTANCIRHGYSTAYKTTRCDKRGNW
jgi:hypothetical protein